MRTTVRLPDELYRRVRLRAHEEGRTVTSLIEESLRRQLDEPRAAERAPYTLVPFGGGGARPGVDLSSNAAMLEAMEEGDARW